MTTALLHSAQSGELLAAEIRVSPRLLEDLLEALASAPFPINPELDHSARPITQVRFPLYESQRDSLHQVLASAGFAPSLLTVHSMATEVALAYESTL
jgi:hypothetical protein